MSGNKRPGIWMVAIVLCTLLVARAQDFESLLQDLTLPSPTALAAQAQSTSPAATAPFDEVEPAAEAAPAMDDFFGDAQPADAPMDGDLFAAEAEVAPEPAAEEAPSVEPEMNLADDAFFMEAAETVPVEQPAAVEEPGMTEPEFSEELAEPQLMEEAVEAPAPEPVVDATEPAPLDPAFDDFFAEPAPAPVVEPAPAPEPAAEPAFSMDEFFGEDAPAAEAVATVVAPDPEPVEGAMEVEEDMVAGGDAPAALNPEMAGIDPALIAQQEEVRRQAREMEGRQSAAKGLAAFKEGRTEEAIAALSDAREKIPERAATRDLLKEVNAALPQAYLRKSEAALGRGDLRTSREALEAAKSVGADARQVSTMDRRLVSAEKRDAELKARPVPVKDRPEIVNRDKSVQELIVEGRQYFNVRDYNTAEKLFEQVLTKDEYNVDAMRFLRRIDEVRFKIRSQERESTAADLMQQVRDRWNPPTRTDTVAPDAIVNRGAVETQTAAQKLQEKMANIIIPIIDFRQANINDVINYLRDESVKADKDGVGVNIILNPNVVSGVAAAPAPAPVAAPPAQDDFGFGGFGDDFGGGFGAAEAAPAQDFSAPAASGVPSITLTLRRISLLDAIKFITEVARLKFRIEENVVMITPENMPSGRVVTRMYPVQPSILDVIIEREATDQQQTGFVEIGAKTTTFRKSDVKEFFEKTGVPFPVGTSITYNQAISQLIVANTPENLEVFERILSRLNVVPNQVEIEARFVEISQDDLEELGFQWLLRDNWELAQRNGGGPFGAATAERIQVDANSAIGGFTRGMRFFGSSAAGIAPVSGAGSLGSIATFSSILTNPELSLVVNALSQHGGTDLLSAPKVTTRSGVNAQIQVIREILYPTEFQAETAQINNSGDSQINVGDTFLVVPQNFEKRETGVILNVTPTVGPDGYTIDLVLAPEVSELVDWIQYGAVDPTTGFPAYNIPQPIFASRNVTTSIVIWDGQTVVMGGLIREDLVRVKDKIPFLGDIPLIGRLFRNEGQFSQKKNLLIFVTARLVDPAGKPINRGDALPDVAEPVASTN
ncbi:MAG TPA: hypothetical protein PKE12_06370 [Kiritimatiellia bacterium]|nr:hypothetical protein [Kiritimatiellia bacterium]